jgi:hypothetical protein
MIRPKLGDIMVAYDAVGIHVMVLNEHNFDILNFEWEDYYNYFLSTEGTFEWVY